MAKLVSYLRHLYYASLYKDQDEVDSGGIFGKKFASTSRFVVSSKVWMNTIPTHDCDVLLTFPAKTDDHTLMWLLARLRNRTPELEVHVRHHSNTGVYGFYLTATYDNLLKGAEELELKKSLKTEYGGGMKEFEYNDRDCYQHSDEEDVFLTSQERQIIVRHMLYNLRAITGDNLNGKIRFLEGQAIVPKLLTRKVISQVLPLHCSSDLTNLRKTWVQAFFQKQPLGKICEYFGVKIAMYFAYLGHYTLALMLPAIFGIFIWTFPSKDQEVEDIWFVVFALFNVFWATLYLEHWKRRSSELAYQWGTLDQGPELLVEPRPLFTGELKVNEVTGRQEFYYPPWKRHLFRYLVTFPVIAVCLLVVLISMLLVFQVDDWMLAKIKAGDLPKFCKFGPKILLALTIGILDDMYKKIAYWLNDSENYREDRSYENHLIIKLVCFQFVNSFLSLFYIAFYLGDMNRLKEQLAALLITRQVVGNFKEALLPYIIEKVKLFQLGYKMTANISPDTLDKEMMHMIGKKAKGNGDPSLTDDTNRATTPVPGGVEEISFPSLEKECSTEGATCPKKEENHTPTTQVPPEFGCLDVSYSGPQLTQAEVESAMKLYDDTFEDYLEMFIQFGYVILFSSAFPLAALCALLNNIIEIRSDAFKLCMTFQRPFGQRVENIGIWQDMLELMGVIAVIVNCALVGMSGQVHRLFPNMGPTETIVFIVVLEHIILAFKCSIAYAIPDIPYWVEQQMAKWEFGRREALKRFQSKSTKEKAQSLNHSSSNESCPSDTNKVKKS
ncbi:anoctamin-8-like isoform X2 [Lineus longissimus]|uniref:anoctamin-8-like isoform X2 n=1 Tax=Lineus longissimus TaxID=88925 RepID=UPI002B4DF6B9